MSFIYLPLYSDRDNTVHTQSGLNAWNGASKNPSTNEPRPRDEVYIPIPKWVHEHFPYFFGFDALDPNQQDASINNFYLHSPIGRWNAIITQQNSKALETNPQSDLGKWILRDILNLSYGTVLTMDMLKQKGIDSVKITKINSDFRIDIAPFNAFRNWKVTL
ncbi:hypothetical protein JEP40_13510 [Proteus vulgaris]|uniref:hypothetical protein n=1 Tax=Proteus vulgaris TaxID=585 RepID=UPI0018E453AB|nr:hypothetical protein [Proteus vulgaris]MBI6530127.1 hypothetical protein [Proteus vulgaris]